MRADVIYEDKDIYGGARWPERAQLATSSMRDKVIYERKARIDCKIVREPGLPRDVREKGHL
jgi:hypothetical protein